MMSKREHKTNITESDLNVQKNLGLFGPIPIRSGCLGPDLFGPVGSGRFGPISKVGCFGLIFGVSRFGLIYLFIFRK